ncbi:MAG TPA: ABC transporter substrate-binding protein [Bacillota bacterium]|nr:ABC transporter substrate-binding protein [Bacillota bacterium]
MRRTRWLAWLGVLILAAATVACGGAAAPAAGTSASASGSGSAAAPATSANVLRIAIATDPTGLDPESVLQNEAGFVMSTLYDGLTSYAPGTTNVQPGLAQSWTITPDGKTYVFTLRQGVKFSDGTALDSSAVVAWLDRILNKQNPNYVENQKGISDFNSFTFGDISAYKALGPTQVEIDLSKPNAELLADLAMAWSGVVSPAAVTKYGADMMKNPAGTGPFTFVKWVQGQYIEVRANPDYWGGKPKLDEIFFEVIPDPSTRLLDLQQGKVNILADVPPQNVAALRANTKLHVLTQPGLAVSGISMPNQVAPFNDVRVRQALNYAVDKEALNKDLYFGLATTMDSPDTPVEWSYAKQTPYTFDLAKAKSLLAAAGQGSGFSATIDTYANPRGYNPAGGAKLAQAVQADLAQVGVTLKINQMDFAAYLSAARQNSFADLGSVGWSGDNGDPDDFMQPLYGSDAFGEGNFAHYSNPKVDQLFAQGIQTPDQNQRKQIYSQIEAQVWQDAPWIFINYATQVRAETANVHGYQLNPTEMFFDMQDVSLSGS